MTVVKAERLAQREFPAGTSREQVEGWLAENGVPYETYPATDVLPRDFPSGLNRSQIGYVVGCGYQNAWVDPIFNGWIDIVLYFDKDDKVVWHEIKRHLIMP
jgi:hypothetical protein